MWAWWVVGRKPGEWGSQTSGVTGVVWVGWAGEWRGAKGWELGKWGARSLGQESGAGRSRHGQAGGFWEGVDLRVG